MKRHGFTLMEMLVVLAIVGMLFAGAFRGMASLNDERALRAPLNELRSMAKKAWQRSMQEQRAWQIRFRPGGMVLEPGRRLRRTTVPCWRRRISSRAGVPGL